MVTTVGTEKDIYKLLAHLTELDYDAIDAYKAAVERIDSKPIRDRLSEFMADHVRHTGDLSRVLVESGRTAPAKGDIKRVLTKGKVIISGLLGDRAILMAMKTNEDDTNAAYERAAEHPEASGPLREVLRRGLEDERRHRAWIEQQIAHL